MLNLLLENRLLLSCNKTHFHKKRFCTSPHFEPLEIYKFHSFFLGGGGGGGNVFVAKLRVIHLPYRVKPSNLLLGILFVFELKNKKHSMGKMRR